MVINISNKKINIKNIPGPTGVRGRNSENTLYHEKMGWKVSESLKRHKKNLSMDIRAS